LRQRLERVHAIVVDETDVLTVVPGVAIAIAAGVASCIWQGAAV